MTVRVERTIHVDAPIERVWAFIDDPANRASAIGTVDRFETTPEGQRWYLRLPLPFVDRTVAVETRTVDRDPPRFVRFTGSGPALTVEGTHELTATENGTDVANRFVVEGRLPGVERYFRRRLDAELDNLEGAIQGACAA